MIKRLGWKLKTQDKQQMRISKNTTLINKTIKTSNGKHERRKNEQSKKETYSVPSKSKANYLVSLRSSITLSVKSWSRKKKANNHPLTVTFFSYTLLSRKSERDRPANKNFHFLKTLSSCGAQRQ